MKIQIEFDLPDEVLSNTSALAAKSLFQAPEWGKDARIGYTLIEDAAKKAISEIDWSPIVKAEIARLTPDVVHDVVGVALKAMVKAQVKAMKETGELLI